MTLSSTWQVFFRCFHQQCGADLKAGVQRVQYEVAVDDGVIQIGKLIDQQICLDLDDLHSIADYILCVKPAAMT